MSGARLALTLCVTKAREGSEADLDALEHMFQQLGFESTMKRDPTAQVLCCRLQPSRGGVGAEGEGGFQGHPCVPPFLSLQQFQEELEKFQQAIDAREDFVSCAFVVLMAHGLEGRLKGKDERMVELEDLFQALNNKNCRALRAKPKVYIVQACRGGGAKSQGHKAPPSQIQNPSQALGFPSVL